MRTSARAQRLCFSFTAYALRHRAFGLFYGDRTVFTSMIYISLYYLLAFFKINHTVSRVQPGRQREPSVKRLRSSLFADFSSHCWVAELNARLLPWCYSVEMKILRNNNSFPRAGIELTALTPLYPCTTTDSIITY